MVIIFFFCLLSTIEAAPKTKRKTKTKTKTKKSDGSSSRSIAAMAEAAKNRYEVYQTLEELRKRNDARNIATHDAILKGVRASLEVAAGAFSGSGGKIALHLFGSKKPKKPKKPKKKRRRL